MTDTVESVKAFATEYIVPFGLHVLGALVVFIIGRSVSRLVLRGANGLMMRSRLDVSLRKFLGNLFYAGMLGAVAVAALDTAGVKTTALVAVIGAAGIAVGLAVQGSLSNFAAGIMLLVIRPYKVGDVVVFGKFIGRVDDLNVFHTVVITLDARVITIPNAQIIAGPIENLTGRGRRRIDVLVTITAATSELAEVKALLGGVAREDDRVDRDPDVISNVVSVTDAGAVLRVQSWTAVEHYGPLAAALMENFGAALRSHDRKFTITLETPVA